MQKYAIIVAGGTGTRMGHTTPKQFLMLYDKPVLYYTIKAFLEAYDDLEIVLVLPEAHTEMGREIVDGYFDYDRIKITAGGETRFHSVQKGLRLIERESVVFVHDGVRCLLSVDLIRRCYKKTMEQSSAVPVLFMRDSLRMLAEDDSEAVDRNRYVSVQTPQTFHSKILIPAFEIDYKEKFTDEATVVEAFGLKISLLEGEETNIKITRPLDLLIAEKILESRLALGVNS